MAFFRKIKEFYYETMNMYRQISLDNKNRKLYLRTVREECIDPQSRFVKMNIKLADDQESLVYVTNIPAELQASRNDFMIQERLNENTYFISEFLRKDAGFANYISLPEYFHIEDPSSDDISVLYLAVWKFNPIVYPSLKRKALAALYGSITAVAGALGYVGYLLLI